MRNTLLILMLICYSTSCFGQNVGYFAYPFEYVVIDNKPQYIGQTSYGKKNGLGLLIKRNRDLYIGNFSKNKIHGFGFFISHEKSFISNCDSCVAYIGDFVDGKKDGRGCCYDQRGFLMYQGAFSNDKPLDPYPAYDTLNDKIISLLDIGGSMYIGEISIVERMPDGFGVVIYENGDFFEGRFSEGKIVGVGLYATSNNEWEMLNYKRDGSVAVISSATEYATINETRKAINQKIIKETFSELANEMAQLSETIQGNSSIANSNTDHTSDSFYNKSGSNPSQKSCSFYQDQYRREENFVKTMYSGMTSGSGYSKKDKEGKDREGKTSGNWSAIGHITNMKNLHAGQKRMRKIRQEAQRNGCSIPQSNYETVTVNY